MIFLESEERLSNDDIDEVESDLHIRLPIAVRSLYLESNGGIPSPYVFANQEVDTVVAELLPLKAIGKGTAGDAFKKLVLTHKLVPKSMFPFAVDGSGDYFFVDWTEENGHVYLYRGDTAADNPLLDLEYTFNDFWRSLIPE